MSLCIMRVYSCIPQCRISLSTEITKGETSRQSSPFEYWEFWGLSKPSSGFRNSRYDVNIRQKLLMFCLQTDYICFTSHLSHLLCRRFSTVWSHHWRTSSTSSLCTSSLCSSLPSLLCSSLKGSSSTVLTAPWKQRRNASKWISEPLSGSTSACSYSSVLFKYILPEHQPADVTQNDECVKQLV